MRHNPNAPLAHPGGPFHGSSGEPAGSKGDRRLAQAETHPGSEPAPGLAPMTPDGIAPSAGASGNPGKRRQFDMACDHDRTPVAPLANCPDRGQQVCNSGAQRDAARALPGLRRGPEFHRAARISSGSPDREHLDPLPTPAIRESFYQGPGSPLDSPVTGDAGREDDETRCIRTSISVSLEGWLRRRQDSFDHLEPKPGFRRRGGYPTRSGRW